MARDIIIYPFRGSILGGEEPRIEYTGKDAGAIKLRVEDIGTVNHVGSAGGLQSITDTLTGDLFSVNDISNTALLKVKDTGEITMGPTLSGDLKITSNGNVEIDGEFTVGASTLFVDSSTLNVGIGTITPDASAVLDLTSTTQGLLPPRVTTVQKNAIVLPATSLMVFDTDTAQYEFNSGTPGAPTWTALGGGGGTTLYTGDGTVSTTRLVGLTDTLAFDTNLLYLNGSGSYVGIGRTTSGGGAALNVTGDVFIDTAGAAAGQLLSTGDTSKAGWTTRHNGNIRGFVGTVFGAFEFTDAVDQDLVIRNTTGSNILFGNGTSSQLVLKSDGTLISSASSIGWQLNAAGSIQTADVSLENKMFSNGLASIAPVHQLSKGRGTTVSPAAVQSSDILGRITYTGYNGTDYDTEAVELKATALVTHSPSDAGTEFKISTIKSGGTLLTQALLIDGDGLVNMNNASNSFKFPNARGAAGQVLIDTLGDGVLAWDDAPGSTWASLTDTDATGLVDGDFTVYDSTAGDHKRVGLLSADDGATPTAIQVNNPLLNSYRFTVKEDRSTSTDQSISAYYDSDHDDLGLYGGGADRFREINKITVTHGNSVSLGTSVFNIGDTYSSNLPANWAHSGGLIGESTNLVLANFTGGTGGAANVDIYFGRFNNVDNVSFTEYARFDSQTKALTIAEAFTFPTTDGTAGQVLQTNGLGVLSWVTP